MPKTKPETSIGYQLAKILKLKRRYIDLEMKELGLSRTQWQVLLGIEILGPCTQKELLKHVDIDAAHLARVLDDFSKNKYIVRTPVKNDRRSLFVEMTEYSKRHFIPKILEALDNENTILLHGLKPTDKKALVRILKILEVNIEAALTLETESALEQANDE